MTAVIPATTAADVTERRKRPRLQISIPALIHIWDGVPPVRCTILNMSSRGSLLRLEAQAVVPDNFALFLIKTGAVRRDCRVVWRRDNFLGVEFVWRFGHV